MKINTQNKETIVGFIGNGFVGGSLANNFEKRGYKIVRYSLEKEFINNKNKVSECPIIVVSIPTPSTPEGFNFDILDEVCRIPKDDAIVVIKSTLTPEAMRGINSAYKPTFIHCPEFLSEDTAQHDTDYPERNIVGIADMNNGKLREAAKKVLEILPTAPFQTICTYEESCLAKYAGNCFFFVKNVYFNMLHDLAEQYGCKWERLHRIIISDSRIHNVHTNPVHKNGRGAGGHCLIKDMKAFIEMYDKNMDDILGGMALHGLEGKNNINLMDSKKDLDLLEGCYGKLVNDSFVHKDCR